MKKRKKEEKHDHKAAALFIVAVLIVCGMIFLREPRVVSYATARNSIEVMNKQSYTNVGGTWTIRFLTQGQGELEISEVKDSFYYLSPLQIRCGNGNVNYELKGGSIIIKDYKCDTVGSITTQIQEEGIQTLRISFGNRAYVMNIAAKKENI